MLTGNWIVRSDAQVELVTEYEQEALLVLHQLHEEGIAAVAIPEIK